MVFNAKKTSEQLILESDRVDLSKAAYSEDLSFAALDEESSHFSVTMDRIHFRKPLEVIQTVLEANGFASNFENLLSCFDTLTQGVRIRANDKSSGSGPILARSYMPCLSFQMPAKNRVGYLLKKFYSEIEGYELELARLRTGELNAGPDKKQTREQLKQELERLQLENSRLQSKVSQLTEQLAQAMKSQAYVAKALESNNIIPPQLKTAVVREISMQERTVTMKSGRSAYLVPMAFLRTLPKIGDSCLLNIKDDHITDAYFYEATGRAFKRDLAEVLHIEEQSCKLRDSKRKTYLWTVKHEWEARLLANLKRGSKVIISSIDDYIIKLSVVVEQDPGLWSQLMQEQQTVFQLERDRRSDPDSSTNFDGKD